MMYLLSHILSIRNVAQELSEAILTMVSNAHMILNKQRQPPVAMPTKPVNPGLPNLTSNPVSSLVDCLTSISMNCLLDQLNSNPVRLLKILVKESFMLTIKIKVSVLYNTELLCLFLHRWIWAVWLVAS